MKQTLLSVGIDVGTSTTQIIFSRLTVENKAGPFSVPRMAITDRTVLFRSPVRFTPLLDGRTIDAAGVRDIVADAYRAAGIDRAQVETGAIIITGETARKENAEEVLAALSDFAGDFVVTTAGPDLESVLAARGAGADSLSRAKHLRLLHIDIGGGTANLAFFEYGELSGTGCYDIGGRLVRCAEQIDYVAPVLAGRFPGLEPGRPALRPVLEAAARDMAQTLAQTAGLLPANGRMDRYATAGAAPPRVFHPDAVTFSGGVAACLAASPPDWKAYGDLGPLLARAVQDVFSANGGRILAARETLRATVVGAGSWSTQLSGSTVFHRSVDLPLKNLPILPLSEQEQALPPEELSPLLNRHLDRFTRQSDGCLPALHLRGLSAPDYGTLSRLADGLAGGFAGQDSIPVLVLERDMAKALGQALALRLPGPLLCLDGIAAGQGDYIDIGAPLADGTVFPVVVKTLAFETS